MTEAVQDAVIRKQHEVTTLSAPWLPCHPVLRAHWESHCVLEMCLPGLGVQAFCYLLLVLTKRNDVLKSIYIEILRTIKWEIEHWEAAKGTCTKPKYPWKGKSPYRDTVLKEWPCLCPLQWPRLAAEEHTMLKAAHSNHRDLKNPGGNGTEAVPNMWWHWVSHKIS